MPRNKRLILYSSYLRHGQYFIHQSHSFILFEMSIVVKTLACGSLSNGNSSNGNNSKSIHTRQNTSGVMSSKKVKVSVAPFFNGRTTKFGVYEEKKTRLLLEIVFWFIVLFSYYSGSTANNTWFITIFKWNKSF